jgi:ribosomal protein S12 methylthiotransferase accessory factor
MGTCIVGHASMRSKARLPKRKTAAKSAQSPILFLRPLLHTQARKYTPNADVRVPIRRGDLEEIERGRLVIILDGVEAEGSVSAREIRSAIGRGLRIVGAAGIGALRAAEVHEMIGVGEVYRLLRSGELTRDDEIAVVWDPAAGDSITEPLVNIRFAISQLVKSGSLSREHGDRLLEVASATNFRERSYERIVSDAGFAGRDDSATLIRALKAIDLVREDIVTVLEQLTELDEDPRWEDLAKVHKRGRDYDDELETVRLKRSTQPEAPLMIWECGDQIDFRSLLNLTAMTGTLDGYFRNALLRHVLNGRVIPKVGKKRAASETSAEDVLAEICELWGWEATSELHVTLSDLGFGESAFTRGVFEEHRSRDLLAATRRRMPNDLMRGLRFEMLADDLGLKREAMRMSALLGLAASAKGAPTALEIHDAKRALLAVAAHNVRVETWDALKKAQGLSETGVAEIVELVALARRRGVTLLENMERAGDRAGHKGSGVEGLPSAPYASGNTRSISDVEAVAVAKKIGNAIGVTRVAQLSQLERIGGLHVTAAYRSRGMSIVGSGKSESLEGAIVGGIMEQAETYCLENFEAKDSRLCAFDDWTRMEAVDPVELHLPYDSNYKPNRPIQWTWMEDLVSGDRAQVPLGAIESSRTQNDPYFSPRLSKKWFSTNGLASAFTVTEALVHGICERVERHAYKLAEQDAANPGNLPGPRPRHDHVDLETCPASTRRICQSLKDSGGFEVRVIDITSDVTIPTFFARVIKPSSGADDTPDVEFYGPGCCAHPNPEIAINRAILEAVQSIMVNAAGALDVVMKARSLGRHERPRPAGLGELTRSPPYVRKRSFSLNPGFVGKNGRDELDFVIQRLTAACYDRVLFRELTREEVLPARVVRVFIPGMEDVNPLFTGPRARALAVSDLMHRHEW